MIKEIDTFDREEIFKHYHACDNPFLNMTMKVDVTNIVNYCKIHKNFYATMGYLLCKTANKIDNFKYRYQDKKFYYCDELITNYTDMYQNGNIGYFDIPYDNNFQIYIDNFKKIKEQFLRDNNYDINNELNEIWLSCVPWMKCSSIISPFNKNCLIPQIIWDKYELENDKYYINLTIVIHHGFADGYHVAQFIKLLEENIKNF